MKYKGHWMIRKNQATPFSTEKYSVVDLSSRLTQRTVNGKLGKKNRY